MAAERKIIAVCGAMMTPDIAEFGMRGLPENLADHFVMHPWQAMQILNCVPLEQVSSRRGVAITPGEPGWNMCGIRVVEDSHFAQDYIELRDKDEYVLVEYRNVGSLSHQP